MFIKIKHLYINFDTVTCYWENIKEEEWHTADGVKIQKRYFFRFEQTNDKMCGEIEFDNQEELDNVMNMLNRELKPVIE